MKNYLKNVPQIFTSFRLPGSMGVWVIYLENCPTVFEEQDLGASKGQSCNVLRAYLLRDVY